MSDTPLTDEQVLAYLTEDGSELVHASTARELETKLAAIKADFEKLALSAAQTADRNVELRCRAEKAEAKIITARSALSRIANSDYRGNRSTESQIAFAALEEIK